MSDLYQGKPIRPDRGMMILDHHHSEDTTPTPSSIFPFLYLYLYTSFTFLSLSLFLRFIHLFLYQSPLPFFLSLPSSPILDLCLLSFSLSLSLLWPNFLPLFLAHKTFNISFQIMADASKKWPNESYLLSSSSVIMS